MFDYVFFPLLYIDYGPTYLNLFIELKAYFNKISIILDKYSNTTIGTSTNI